MQVSGKDLLQLLLMTLYSIFFANALQWTFIYLLEFYMGDSGFSNFADKQKLGFKLWFVYMAFFRWCYYAGMESSPLRATIGKLAVGIYVTDEIGERDLRTSNRKAFRKNSFRAWY